MGRDTIELENEKGGRERRNGHQVYHFRYGWAPVGWRFGAQGHLHLISPASLAGGLGGGNERPKSPKAKRWIAYGRWRVMQQRQKERYG